MTSPIPDAIHQIAGVNVRRKSRLRSVGGSCALEITALAPERVAALVLIGTKADHKPDATLYASVLESLQNQGVETGWQKYWEPLFSAQAHNSSVKTAKRIALGQSAETISRGVTAFHTRKSRGDLLYDFPRQIHFITGERDTAPGLKKTAEQARSCRDGHLHVIPGCGHYVPIERPNELNAILAKLISEHPQRTRRDND